MFPCSNSLDVLLFFFFFSIALAFSRTIRTNLAVYLKFLSSWWGQMLPELPKHTLADDKNARGRDLAYLEGSSSFTSIVNWELIWTAGVPYVLG